MLIKWSPFFYFPPPCCSCHLVVSSASHPRTQFLIRVPFTAFSLPYEAFRLANPLRSAGLGEICARCLWAVHNVTKLPKSFMRCKISQAMVEGSRLTERSSRHIRLSRGNWWGMGRKEGQAHFFFFKGKISLMSTSYRLWIVVSSDSGTVRARP